MTQSNIHNPFKAALTRLAPVALLGLLLAACSETEIILPGERIAIRPPEQAAGLEIDAAAAAEGALLTPAQENRTFSSPGGGGNHGGGHYAAEFPLTKIFSARTGSRPAEDNTELAQPVAGEDAVYTITPGGIITAFSPDDGRVIWKTDIDPSGDKTQPSINGGLALSEDSLFAHAGKERLVALDAADGSEKWAANLPQHLTGGPVVERGVVIITDITGRIYAFHRSAGEALWNRIGTHDATRAAGAAYPAVAGEVVIVPGGGGELLALGTFDGAYRWGDTLTPANAATALDNIGDITAHPVHDGVRVYAATQSGIMTAYTAHAGRPLWDLPLRVARMPWLAGETLFIVSVNNELFAIRRSDGAVRWRADLPGKYDPSEPPAKKGKRIRHTAPVVVAGRVLLANSAGDILVFDAGTGEGMGSIRIGTPITTDLSVANGKVFALDRRSILHAWE